jgi:hypothetical protein
VSPVLTVHSTHLVRRNAASRAECDPLIRAFKLYLATDSRVAKVCTDHGSDVARCLGVATRLGRHCCPSHMIAHIYSWFPSLSDRESSRIPERAFATSRSPHLGSTLAITVTFANYTTCQLPRKLSSRLHSRTMNPRDRGSFGGQLPRKLYSRLHSRTMNPRDRGSFGGQGQGNGTHQSASSQARNSNATPRGPKPARPMVRVR